MSRVSCGATASALADSTYIATGEGWLYLAAALDLATRRIVGWSMRITCVPSCRRLR